jgi:phosphoheptose isomerase
MLDNFFEHSAKVIKSLTKHSQKLVDIANAINATNERGNKILIAGNGGSCADSIHFAGELVCTYKKADRIGYNAIALAANQAAITAWANDFGFDSFYKRQVDSLGREGDILFLISTGGGNREKGYSMNLVGAADLALEQGMTVISLVGKTGGELHKISNHSILVESDVTAHIQQAHITLIHAICELLERG